MLEIDTPALPLDRPETIEADTAAAVALARSAIAAFPGKDLAGYSVIECADDVDAVRRALGYERISLYAGSFGSQWSLAIMRRHPQIVARAVLANLEPLDAGYDLPSYLFAAMQRIAFDADRDPGLAPWLPEGGLVAAVRAVLDRLAAKPVSVTLEDDGARRTLVLGAGDFQQSLLARAYDSASWPAFVLGVYHGRYDDWARDSLARRAAGRMAAIGPLIDTGLGLTAAREHLLRTDPALPVIGAWGYAGYLAAAPIWPTPDVGDDFRQAVPSAIPVVFVHGDWDTSTPIENALGLLPYFRNGRLVTVHRGLHDSAMFLLHEQPALQKQLVAFLRTGDAGELPASTSLAPPAFKRPDFAPPAR
jgi:pimeloyl-ACP methyl ester carboxylesterase